MADVAGAADASASARNHRQHALADIHFSSLRDSDLTQSEDESPDEKLELETLQSAIGVSIGQQQTRLTSPRTPAAEKAAALDETDGSILFEGWEQTQHEHSPPPRLVKGDETEERGDQKQQDDNERSQVEHQARTTPKRETDSSANPRLPSPWRAAPKSIKILDSKARRRTLSGSNMGESFKKYMPFNFPSLPKTSNLLNFSLPSFSVSNFDNARGRPFPHGADRTQVNSRSSLSPYRNLAQHGRSAQPMPTRQTISTRRSRSLSRPRPPNTAPLPQRDSSADTDTDTDRSQTPYAPHPVIQRRPTPVLRRSNSEGSLLMYRTRSIASSLGDDSRFEHVSEQVNSRIKAIKDSWQDSNFKLSVPSLPNFSFGSREDLFRSSKSGPGNFGEANGDAIVNNRVSFLANSSKSARPSSMRLPKAKSTSPDRGSMAATHPNFAAALEELEGDLVILGGYRGSILRSAEPPHRQLWVPIKVGLNLRKVDLEVGLEPEDEERMEESIIPAGMLTHIGPVDIGRRLFKRLRASENAQSGKLRIHNYGYDWRLSPHLLSRKLIKFLESLPCNQPGVAPEKRGAIVIAHSLGGLITRHAINQRPDLVSGVVYAGVPQSCINILGPLRNGDDVLLSSRVLTAQVNFTIRTSYALLPLDGHCFINKHTKEEYPVDFFDINTWMEHRLSPCIAPAIPAQIFTASNLSVSSLLNAMSQALPSLPGRKGSISKGSLSPTFSNQNSSNTSKPESSSTTNGLVDTARNAADKVNESSAKASGMEPSMQTSSPHPTTTTQTQTNPSTAVTIPQDKAIKYLTRTLAEIKVFKQQLAHNPTHTEANAYPPIALIYGKSIPTVWGAKVESRDAIKYTSAYDELAFASGDGVVLAKAAMAPKGYSVVRGGVVPSERGHVTLLGDLEAVGRCLGAVIKARKKGVGLGIDKMHVLGGGEGESKGQMHIDGNMGEGELKKIQP